MIALLQRVTHASVIVNDITIGKIDNGILVFLAIEPDDTEQAVKRLSERILGYRIFADTDGKMNLNVRDINGGVLIVPQFTLAADTSSGMRPSFSTAANPIFGAKLFDYFVEQIKLLFPNIATGKFGADMKVSICNDGPVTFVLKQKS